MHIASVAATIHSYKTRHGRLVNSTTTDVTDFRKIFLLEKDFIDAVFANPLHQRTEEHWTNFLELLAKAHDSKRYSVRVLKDEAGDVKGSAIVLPGKLNKIPLGHDDTGVLHVVYMDKNYRGKGYGKGLIQSIIKDAKQLGFKELFLDTNNPMAAYFYTKAGFRVVESPRDDIQEYFINRMNHTKPSVVMHLELEKHTD